jgi:hypothetical protein
MTPAVRFASVFVCAGLALSALSLTGCGSSSTAPAASTSVVLLDTSVSLLAGVTCNTGNVAVDFTGTAGKSVAIAATGAATLNPHFTLYAPDFATQLAGSTSSAGAASLTYAITLNGVHHLSLCDANGVAGALHVTVTQQ